MQDFEIVRFQRVEQPVSPSPSSIKPDGGKSANFEFSPVLD